MPTTRRHFLLTSTTAAAMAALYDLRLLAQAAQAPPATSFDVVRGAVRIFTGRGGTIGVRRGKSGLVVVDTQFPDTARACLDTLQKEGSSEHFTVFNTHHHGDHTGGNKVFKDAGAEIWAHANVPALQRKAAEEAKTVDAQAFPDETFGQSAYGGSEQQLLHGQFEDEVALAHHGPAHTGGDTVVHFVHEDVVHMGDLVFNRRHPFIDRPAGASIENWIVVLETVAKAHGTDTKYIFGHAGEGHPLTGARADLQAMRDYLTALLEAARTAVKKGMSRDEFAATKLPASFAVYDPKTPPPPDSRFGLAANLRVAFDEASGAK